MKHPDGINISETVFNAVYLPLLTCRTRYLVLYGGAGSGKSVFAVQRFLIRLLAHNACNLLVIRKVAATHRDSTYALFRQVAAAWHIESLFRFHDSRLRITCLPTGNEVVFKGLDDAEKLKSITFSNGLLTDIWVEEASEITEGDFNQLDIRLRGRGIQGQMVLTFNPISQLHWLKRRFFDQQDPQATVLKTTYLNNRFLDPDYADMLTRFETTDPYYYSVYCLGEWGVLGSTIFDQASVAARLQSLSPPQLQGDFHFETVYDPRRGQAVIADRSIQLLPSASGAVQVYRLPQAGHLYVIGADTAGEGSDWFCGQVVDHMTGEQVCTLRQKYDEDLFAKQLYCLGIYYETALIAVEANFSSYPIRELERLGYPRQYVRETPDTFTHKPLQSFGFRTTSTTRPLILAGLVTLVREHCTWLNDRETLAELLTFVRNEHGRAEAQAGAHDDCVMALAIAYHCRDQQPSLPHSKRSWTADMLADYHKADIAQKTLLLKKWG